MSDATARLAAFVLLATLAAYVATRPRNLAGRLVEVL
jgi:hypothetical protein